jgi:hypothetical protein
MAMKEPLWANIAEVREIELSNQIIIEYKEAIHSTKARVVMAQCLTYFLQLGLRREVCQRLSTVDFIQTSGSPYDMVWRTRLLVYMSDFQEVYDFFVLNKLVVYERI